MSDEPQNDADLVDGVNEDKLTWGPDDGLVIESFGGDEGEGE